MWARPGRAPTIGNPSGVRSIGPPHACVTGTSFAAGTSVTSSSSSSRVWRPLSWKLESPRPPTAAPPAAAPDRHSPVLCRAVVVHEQAAVGDRLAPGPVALLELLGH